MRKPRRLTAPGREKIVREMTDVFRKHGVYSHIAFVYNNKMVMIGSSELTKESDYEEYSEPTIKVREDRKPSDYGAYDDNTIVVMYDGGPLYSARSGEFGWDWWERIRQDLEVVLGPYHLGIESIDHVSFELIDGVVPDYERVADRLSNC